MLGLIAFDIEFLELSFFCWYNEGIRVVARAATGGEVVAAAQGRDVGAGAAQEERQREERVFTRLLLDWCSYMSLIFIVSIGLGSQEK